MPEYLRLLGERIHVNGYNVIPIAPGSKAPIGVKDWATTPTTPKRLRYWGANGHRKDGIGITTKYNPCVDIDSLDEACSIHVFNFTVASLHLGIGKIGQPPKRAIIYRCETPFKKISSRVYRDDEGRKAQVEILGDGQQTVIYHIHPVTQQPYSYPWKLTPLNKAASDLPIMTEADGHAIVEEFHRYAEEERGWQRWRERGWPLWSEPAAALPLPAPRDDDDLGLGNRIVEDLSVEELRERLMFIPNDGRFDDRSEWLKIVSAVSHQTQKSDDGHDMAWEWSAQHKSHSDALFEKAWNSFGNYEGDAITARYIIKLSNECGYKPKKKKKKSTKILMNEDEMASAFAKHHRNDLHFCHHVRAWYKWNGNYWKQEEKQLAFHWARLICRHYRLKANHPDADALARISTASAVEKACRADPVFAVTSEIFDCDPWLLGTPAGTVELKTGELRPGRQEDLITKIAAVAPSHSGCPQWLRFLDQVTKGDAGLIRFLQQWCGYSLTGDIREHALIFMYGPGGNGKSVLLNTLTGILGDYAKIADMETFAQQKFARHSTDIAMLRGARVVGASETEEGRAWAENRIKQMTGGDPITARFMRMDNFTFWPEFKLTFIGNNKPRLHNVDEATRRRFNIVPFSFVPKEKDLELEAKLKTEWPEILGWMIEGCIDWLNHGLIRPPVVVEATETYFAEQDTIGQWLAECCELGKPFVAGSTELYASYSTFAEGEVPISQKAFSESLAKRKFAKVTKRDGVKFSGLKLRDDDGYDEA